jgi:ABC-2 type transport system ATP-binding protein
VDWVEKRPDKTVLLTTHYMAEADQLCDRIAIIDDGKILACDTPDNLKKLVKTSTLLKIDTTYVSDKQALNTISGVEKFTFTDDPTNNLTSLKFVLQDESAVSDIVSEIVRSGSKILALRKTEPTLEDVFIKMVGKGFD